MIGLVGKDMILTLVLASTFLSQAISPPSYEDLNEEMRGYVLRAADFLGYEEYDFASHINYTSSWAHQSLLSMGDSRFYIIVFDRKFVEEQPTEIRKAIAAHEVGHAYYTCENLYSDYYYGYGTYLDSENCADVVSSTIFGYKAMDAALRAIKEYMPDARAIDERIKMLHDQVSPWAIRLAMEEARRNYEKDLTPDQ